MRFLLPLLFLSSMAQAAEPARPNIILIIADDMAWDDCGAYGNRGIRTPNIDRLARAGMRFDQAFLTCSSCSPSRSSLITGRYPHNTGAEQLHWPLPKDQVTFVEKLKAAGYWTAAAGKWHLGNAVKDRFDVVHDGGTAAFQLPTGKDEEKAEPPTKDGSGCEMWVPTLQSRPKDKPFFLWLAAFDPHRDYQPGAIPQPHRPEDVTVPPYLPDVPETRKDLALYYDEIARLDGYVGRVLDELKKQKVEENTLVLFMSDNGRPFPRCKTTVYDSGIKTPFLVRWPGKVKAGSTCPGPVSSIDIAPTFLELAGLQAGGTFQGQSFLPLLHDPQGKGRELVFAEHNWHDFEARSRAVRAQRFKYIRNEYPDLPNTPPADAVRSITFQAMRKLRDQGQLTPAQMMVFTRPLPAEELYDTEADPHELKNLAGDPQYKRILDELRQALDNWKKANADVPPEKRTLDEFDRENGQPLPNRERPRLPPKKP
jgi:arylsulfatase A-like enzyme